MKEFSEFSKGDQKLIAEALGEHNKMISGVEDNGRFEFCIQNMTGEAREFLLEKLKCTLPAEFNL